MNPTFSFIVPHKDIPDLLMRCMQSIPKSEDILTIVVDDISLILSSKYVIGIYFLNYLQSCRFLLIFANEMYICDMDQKDKQKKELIRRLKNTNSFWSYKTSAIKDVPDDILVELVMLHLDLDDINILFEIYPYKFVKKAWIENVIVQGEMYYVLNKFFAWYYFKMKKPGAYVRSMATRELNRKLTA